MKIFAITFLSFLALVLLAWATLDSTGFPWPVPLLGLFGAYLLMFERTNAWLFARRLLKRTDDGMEVELEFSRNGIKLETPLVETTVKWKGLVKVVDVNDGFLLYPLTNFFHWVPFSAFESADCIEQVRLFVTENNVPLIQLQTGKRTASANETP